MTSLDRDGARAPGADGRFVALSAELSLPLCDAVGGKARGLGRLRGLGLPCPEAWASCAPLLPELLPGGLELPARLDAAGAARLLDVCARVAATPLPPAWLQALDAVLRALAAGQDEGGARPLYAVRSSFGGEDDPRALAPGVYLSRVGVPGAEVPAAIAAVLASALHPAAVAYARARGADPLTGPHAVLVHRALAGEAQGHAIWDGGVEVEVLCGELTPARRDELARLLAEAARRDPSGAPFEVEWLARARDIVLLQWRPHPGRPRVPVSPEARWPGFAALAPDEAAADWRWDAAHNPLPLSPAQAGLVELVEARRLVPHRQRVIGGYLLWAPGEDRAPPARDWLAPEQVRALADELARGAAALGQPPGLEDAIAFFLRHYGVIGELSAAARAARAALAEFLRAHAPAALDALPDLLGGVDSRATRRAHRIGAWAGAAEPAARARALAGFLDEFGDESAAWDVARPTWREQAGALARLAAGPVSRDSRAASGAARAKVREALPRALQAEFEHLRARARAGARLAEEDDWLYARLQAPVRAALLHLGEVLAGRGLVQARDDVFFLPLPLARALARGEPAGDAAALRARVAAGRAAWQAALRAPPPLAPEAAGATPLATLVGTPTRGRAIARVRHHAPGALDVAPDVVLIATTILPTELPLLHPAAIVTETGGALDHVAAQCRERGLPAVVGVPGALAALPEGALALVDADAGRVVILD